MKALVSVGETLHVKPPSTCELEDALDGAVQALGRLLEEAGLEGLGHTWRLANWMEWMGMELGFGTSQIEAIRWGAYLHDLGKLAMPKHLLDLPCPLESDQQHILNQHVGLGYMMALGIPDLPKDSLDMIRYHHERFDGKGYPDGLSGSQIPLVARLLAVVDRFDFLMTHPFNKTRHPEQAVVEIVSEMETCFCPVAVELFLRTLRKQSTRGDSDEQIARFRH